MDASTKIYGFRVDVVYNETFKLASGLTQSSKQKVLLIYIIFVGSFHQLLVLNRRTRVLMEATWKVKKGPQQMVVRMV